ncbi:MAG: hypothetical protein EOP50_03990 [Sphingobacteriales bacterium]|nr:MAG: hypothetical protein EOP50_03990 [Sphingobacteriales bacterium]
MSKLFDNDTVNNPHFDQSEADRNAGMEHDYEHEQDSAGEPVPVPAPWDELGMEAFGVCSWMPETKGGRK